MLSLAQKRQFHDEGYIKIPGVVPKVLLDEALRAVNHSIGEVGLGGEDMENNRSAFHCAELLRAPVILDLFYKSPVIEIAEELMGKGNVMPLKQAKPYPRFPLSLGEDAPEPRGHIDGIGSGTNGMPKGYYGRGFTAFAVVYLVDCWSRTPATSQSGPSLIAPSKSISRRMATKYWPMAGPISLFLKGR